MPTRFLSDEQRRRYGRYAGEPTEKQLDRYFHLDEADRAIVARLRGDHNRLGFAVQLGTVRFLGTFLDDPTDVPSSVLATMAGQLAPGRPPALDGYRQGRQRWRHVALIRDRYGYRDFALDGQARFRLTRWLYALCWAGDDRPSLLIDRATAWLVGNKVLLPGISTIERLVAQHRGDDAEAAGIPERFVAQFSHPGSSLSELGLVVPHDRLAPWVQGQGVLGAHPAPDGHVVPQAAIHTMTNPPRQLPFGPHVLLALAAMHDAAHPLAEVEGCFHTGRDQPRLP